MSLELDDIEELMLEHDRYFVDFKDPEGEPETETLNAEEPMPTPPLNRY